MASVRYAFDGRAKVTKTPTGLILDGNFSRTGLQKYRNADGTERVEYRSPEEVFSPATIASFRGAPVIEGHEIVTPENWDALAIGSTLEARKSAEKHDGEEWTEGTLTVNRASSIKKIGVELIEVSVGYLQDFDPTPGITPNGERYDGRQTNIRVNHIGLGRPGWAIAGRSARLTLDGNEETPAQTKEETKMPHIVFDGVTCEEGSATHVSLMTKAIAAGEKRISDLTKDLERKDGEISGLQTRIEETSKALAKAQDPKTREDGIRTEIEFRDRMRKVLGPDFAFVRQDGSEIPRNEIVKSAIQKIKPDLVIRNDGIDYLEGVLSTIEADYTPVDYTKREDGKKLKDSGNERNDGADVVSQTFALSAKMYGHSR